MLTEDSPSDAVRSFSKLVERALEKEIGEIVLEETEKAAKQAEENVRRRVKEITIRASANILQKFDMTMRHDQLLIRVDFREGNG